MISSIGVFFLQLLDDVPWKNNHQSARIEKTQTGLGLLESGHLVSNQARDGVMPCGRWRQFTTLLKTIRERHVTMSLLAHGL